MFANTTFAALNQSTVISFSDVLNKTSTTVEPSKKMTLKEKIILKKALKQKTNSDEPEISKGLYILLAILCFGWLGMGILDDFEGENWIIGLLLYCLGGLPGLIYTLIKMKDYY